jgi:urease beta subunit
LGKLGSNVNQIARAINRQQAAGQRMDMPAEAAARVLHEIETLSSALIKRLSDGH